jgi:hypothetical protein
MIAGSKEAIVYAFFVLIDEILHNDLFAIFENCEWRFRFCQWAHRKD